VKCNGEMTAFNYDKTPDNLSPSDFNVYAESIKSCTEERIKQGVGTEGWRITNLRHTKTSLFKLNENKQ